MHAAVGADGWSLPMLTELRHRLSTDRYTVSRCQSTHIIMMMPLATGIRAFDRDVVASTLECCSIMWAGLAGQSGSGHMPVMVQHHDTRAGRSVLPPGLLGSYFWSS